MTISDEEKGSFLAFLYRIRFDPEIRAAFRETGKAGLAPINQVAEAFGLVHPSYSDILNELHRFYYAGGYPDYDNEYAVRSLRGRAVADANEMWGRLAALLVPEFRTFSEGTIPDFPFTNPPPSRQPLIDQAKAIASGKPPSWW